MKLAIAIASLALASCATISSAPLVERATIRFDGLAMIDQSTRVGDVAITPQRVIEDSRCPINARCVWAGRLILTARIDGDGWREVANFTLGETVRTHGRGLALVSAEPGKLAGAQPQTRATTFGFERRN